MKKFIVHILICASILFIVDKLAYFILKETPKHLYDTRLKKVLDGEMNKELIILGSSKGAGNIIASQIEKETGYESYNLSYMGSDVIFHEFILRKLLQHNKTPKIILLSIDNPAQFIDVKKSKNTLSYRYDKLYPLTIYNEINTELIKQGDKTLLSEYFLLARLSKARFNYNREKPNSNNPLLLDGSMPYIKQKDISDFNFINKENEYHIGLDSQKKIETFEEIEQICERRNIKLYYIFSPTLFKFNNTFYHRFLKLVKNPDNVFVYNNSNDIYKRVSSYSDHSHLMIHSAKAFTTEISTFLKRYSP